MVVENTCAQVQIDVGVLGTGKSKAKKRRRTRRKNKVPKQETNETPDDDTAVIKCNKINVKSQHVISKDSRHIICPCGNTIAIFRRKTGLLEKLFTGHKYNVSNIYVNHQDPTQIISCSSREFLVWDYADVSLAKKYDVQFDALSWHVSPRCYEDVYYKRIVATEEKKKGKEGNTDCSNKVELVKWNITGTCKETVLGYVSKCDKCVAISSNGEHVVYTYKNKLFIYKQSDNTNNSYTFNDSHITCVALHPTELVVGTGDKKGKIILWYNLFGGEEQICVKLHWHNLGVSDMLFTNDGNYLMSGGREGVLVTWQLETQEKSFVPRVGGAIHHIAQSSDDQYICLVLDNNMLKILSAVTSKLTKTIKYLAPAFELPAGLTYHHPTDCLVLNGRPDGVLQFYQPKEDFLKLCVDIIGENRVSDAEGRYVYPTRVKHVAFSHDGTWMATVDEREDRILPTERKLKFWKYSEETKNYSLNTLVDPPHKSTISSLCFCPRIQSAEHDYMTATTSEDGDVKTWMVTKETDRTGNAMESWQIHYIGSYGNNSCYHACFSQDGSMLAVLFSDVTLWDPEDLTFKRCLQFNAKDDEVKHIAFGHNESSRYLIGHSNSYLIVWDVKDMASCPIIWMLQANVYLLACDPYSKFCSVFVKPSKGKMTDLYLFDPASPPPSTYYHNVTKGHACVSSAMFTPKQCNSSVGKSVWEQMGQLYILTKDTDILAVKGKVEEEDNEKDECIDSNERNEQSTFEDLFGSILEEEKSINDHEDMGNVAGERRMPVGNPSSVVIRKMISTPANVLPAADVMCKAYVKSLLIRKSITREAECVPMETEETEESENVNKSEIVDSHVEANVTVISNGNVSRREDECTPSKELLEKLENLNFAFLVDGFK